MSFSTGAVRKRGVDWVGKAHMKQLRGVVHEEGLHQPLGICSAQVQSADASKGNFLTQAVFQIAFEALLATQAHSALDCTKDAMRIA